MKRRRRDIFAKEAKQRVLPGELLVAEKKGVPPVTVATTATAVTVSVIRAKFLKDSFLVKNSSCYVRITIG